MIVHLMLENILVLFLVYLLSRNVESSTCGTCSGHGVCTTATGVCSCFTGYTGHTCNDKKCPTGTAWADYASATDTAHAEVECSNMGICDYTKGICSCQSGFEGPACEKMSCPTCVNGRCISMRTAATIRDDRNFFVATTYSLWDADKIYGCLCDYGFHGYDCSLKSCPKGDDPKTTGQVDEIQRISCLCNGCSGNFALTFRGETTVNIAPTATLATVKTALENLKTINGVTMTLSGAGSTACDSDGAVISVTFTKNPGNLPSLIASNTFTGGTSALAIGAGGTSGVYDSIGASVDGTKEEAECSNRGLCATATGVCTCQTGYASSDGAGAAGALGDCGFGTTAACPSTTNGACNGQGTCTGSWVCTCNAGWTGHDCSKLVCPTGAAWFDGSSAVDTAHAVAECSNRGICDTTKGTCTCASIVEGSACEKLKCPGTNACNSHGICKTMQELALVSATNGVLNGVTYGNTANKAETWDYNKIQGCHCSQGYYMGPYEGTISDYHAYDCSKLTCPHGPDPLETSKVNEKQTITCSADGGTFTLTFREKTTAAIAFGATAATVKNALEALSTITAATVTFSTGSAVCATTAVVTTVEFTYEMGDLPIMTKSSSLTKTASSATLDIAESVKGTKANIECSRRGSCDRTKGACKCDSGFLSSDGAESFGIRGDCGYKSPWV